jgi:tetratricopeptide (TPR) repeat protein
MERGRLRRLVFLAFSLSAALEPGRLLAATAAQASEDDIEEAIQIFNRGKLLHQEHDYRGAIKEYEVAAKLDDQNPFVFNALGLAFAALRDFGPALKAFNQALQLNPDLTDVYNNMGMVYAEQGAKEKAFEAFSRAVRNPITRRPRRRSTTWATSTSRMGTSSSRKCISRERWRSSRNSRSAIAASPKSISG